jgi:signal transduction histidine kinase
VSGSDDVPRLRLEHVFDALSDLVLTIDRSGHIRTCNEAAARALGVPVDHLTKKTLIEAGFTLVDPVGRAVPLDRINTLPLPPGEMSRAAPLGLALSNGTTFWVRAVITPLIGLDEVTIVATGVGDEARRQSPEIQTAFAELESFGYTVSHDLRSFIISIALQAELAQAALAELRPDDAADALARVARAAERMSDLTEGLIALGQAAKLELVRSTVDLAELAREELTALRRRDDAREVHDRVPAALPVRGDRRLLPMVMRNLIDNAWKFTDGRSPAEIEVGETAVDGERTFYVRDNGIGFDDRQVDLFAPFVRLAGDEFAGSGIGLATVQRVVTRHGGRVWARSQPDHGTTFFFTLGEPAD